MCPSYRVTHDERDVTRGRANTLRLAITGQLGPDALTSDDMAETLKLCVSCKACRRECPTGVDMARMKIEVQAARAAKHGLTLHERLVGWLPRYAPYAAKVPWLMNLRDVLPGAAKLSEAIAGFSSRRSLPRWRPDCFQDSATSSWPGLSRPPTSSFNSGVSSSTERKQVVDGRDKPGHDGANNHDAVPTTKEIVLFADTFNRYFERENLDDARDVLPPPAIAFTSPHPPTGHRARYAAGARSSPSAALTKPSARPSACLQRSRLTSRAPFPSSALSRAAS